MVDNTVLPGLSSIASEQASTTETNEKKVHQLLDYLATHPAAKVRYYASEMILNVHSDASYLSETPAQSCIAGQYFLGSRPKKGQPIVLNGSVFISYDILKFFVASAEEAELGALFSQLQGSKNSYASHLKKWDTNSI